MPYIIDGHNLVPHLPGLDLSDPDDEDQLIRAVQAFCSKKMVQAEIFFDRAAPGHAGRQKFGRVSAVFVPAGKTADQAIIQRLKTRRRAARSDIVVSSDRRVQAEARALGATVLDSSRFASHMRAAQAGKGDGSDEALSDGDIQEWLSIFGETQAGDS